jgi:hypothetical protein
VRIFYPKFSCEELIAKIGAGLPRLNERLPLALVALFGSYAKENYTAAAMSTCSSSTRENLGAKPMDSSKGNSIYRVSSRTSTQRGIRADENYN